MVKKKETVKEAEVQNSTWIVKRALKYGDKGNDIKELQKALIASGYGCGEENGQFGANTKIAVRAFQAAAGLPINGIAGRQTVTALGGEYKE